MSNNGWYPRMPKRQTEITWIERLIIPTAAKGVFILLLRFLRNLKEALLIELGIKRRSEKIATIQYPNDIQEYPTRYRGRHRLTLDEEGKIKCTSCFLCATACPAKCIYIEPAEHPSPGIEKFPHRYEIDTLLCIYCGFCVEACPVDAIRMDTGIHPEVYPTNPNLFIEDKEVLLRRSLIMKKYGKEAIVQNHLRKMQEYEKNIRKFDPSALNAIEG